MKGGWFFTGVRISITGPAWRRITNNFKNARPRNFLELLFLRTLIKIRIMSFVYAKEIHQFRTELCCCQRTEVRTQPLNRTRHQTRVQTYDSRLNSRSGHGGKPLISFRHSFPGQKPTVTFVYYVDDRIAVHVLKYEPTINNRSDGECQASRLKLPHVFSSCLDTLNAGYNSRDREWTAFLPSSATTTL